MRVLNSLTDSRTGGPQIRSLAVARKLKERGVETEFLLPDGDGNFAAEARGAGFTVHTPGLAQLKPLSMVVDNIAYGLQFPFAVRKIRRILRDYSIDIVHANMSMNVETAVAARFTNAALAWHFNDTVVGWPLNHISSRLATALADEIIVASGAVADNYFHGTPHDLNVVYAPVDVEEFDPASLEESDIRTELGVDDDVTLVGTVGNINPLKGHEILVRAFAELRRSVDNAVAAVVVGERLDSREGYFQRLQDLCFDLGVEDSLTFIGRRSDIPRLLASFDIFVFPSVSEACPMAVLEAMAMCKPVVASDVGGIPEQIDDGESGWLVPRRDPEALATALREAIEDDAEALRRGANARRTVVNNFSLDRCVERHLDVYERAIERNR